MIDNFKQFDFPFDVKMEPLFANNIERLVTNLGASLQTAVSSIDANAITKAGKENVINHVVEKFTILPLTVDLEQSSVKKRYFVEQHAISFMFYVPYQGNQELFHYGALPPLADGQKYKGYEGSLLLPNFLMFSVVARDYNADMVNSEVGGLLRTIKDNLDGQRPYIEDFNDSIATLSDEILEKALRRHDGANAFISAIDYADFDTSEVETMASTETPDWNKVYESSTPIKFK